MNPNIDTNIVYELLQNSNKKISVFQGGTRSGKTYNILVWFIIKLLNDKDKVLTICRQSMPALRATAMRDFFSILRRLNIYNEKFHNKSENTYMLYGNTVEFISVDEPQKIRGRKRNYLFLNEANELHYEDWMQLLFRTTSTEFHKAKIVLDYNPSDEYHWIYEQVVTRDDCDFSISTYLDNPFLSKEDIKEIERLREADESYWKVYGLGQRGSSKELIYTHWKEVDKLPNKGVKIYGLDFGYNHPTALIEVEIYEGAVYANELIYTSKLTTSDLIQVMKNIGVNSRSEIFADAAEPKTIEEIFRTGFNIKPADKSVHDGILKIKSLPLFITRNSFNLLKEAKSYKWMIDKNQKVLEDPVKFMDDALDALRYAVYTYDSKFKNMVLIPEGWN